MSKQSKGKELPANYTCPSNPNNMDCNACGGEVCGQKKIPRDEWIVKNWEERNSEF